MSDHAAKDLLAPLGPPARLHDWLEARTPSEAWDQTDEGDLLLTGAARLGADRATIAKLLRAAADSQPLRDWIATGDDAALRTAAREALHAAAFAPSGAQRRAHYARYAAMAVPLMGGPEYDPRRESAGYAHAAQRYGQRVSAAKVRAEVPWSRVDQLIGAGGMPERPEDPQPERGNDRDAL